MSKVVIKGEEKIPKYCGNVAETPEGADLEGAVFSDQHYADRAFTPSLGGILADLIRRGELRRGNYIFKHWW